MAIVKALLLAGLGALGIFLIIVWIIPITIFLIIFLVLFFILYPILKKDQRVQRPP